MNKLVILVGFTLNLSMLFAQDCNLNVFSEEEAIKLSTYAKDLEKKVLDKNPGDTALIAKLQGDFSKDLCGYTDEAIIKISNYLKELEKLDSLNNVKREEVKPVEEKPVIVEEIKPVLPPVVAKSSETLFFASNSAVIKVANFDALIAQLKADKNAKVEINGYTDATASSQYNIALSKKRAKAAKAYLVSKGIEASRITTNAYGEENPIADNETPEGKAKNRRVVISVK